MSACRRRDGKPKVAYATEAEAQTVVGNGENAYQCRRCVAWHVGHTQTGRKPSLLAKYRRQIRRQRRKGAWV